MVIDKLTHIREYALPHLDAAMACLEGVKDKEPGRYEFDGGFILIQAGTTAPLAAADFEAHKKYLDVQILLEGTEVMEWADIDGLSVTVPYNEQADRSNHTGNGCTITIRPGIFYVCYPHDAHKASGHMDAPTTFRKAVVKLSLAE